MTSDTTTHIPHLPSSITWPLTNQAWLVAKKMFKSSKDASSVHIICVRHRPCPCCAAIHCEQKYYLIAHGNNLHIPVWQHGNCLKWPLSTLKVKIAYEEVFDYRAQFTHSKCKSHFIIKKLGPFLDIMLIFCGQSIISQIATYILVLQSICYQILQVLEVLTRYVPASVLDK